MLLQASHGSGAGGKVRFAGGPAAPVAYGADQAAWAYAELEAVSDDDMPDDFQMSGGLVLLYQLAGVRSMQALATAHAVTRPMPLEDCTGDAAVANGCKPAIHYALAVATRALTELV